MEEAPLNTPTVIRLALASGVRAEAHLFTERGCSVFLLT